MLTSHWSVSHISLIRVGLTMKQAEIGHHATGSVQVSGAVGHSTNIPVRDNIQKKKGKMASHYFSTFLFPRKEVGMIRNAERSRLTVQTKKLLHLHGPFK